MENFKHLPEPFRIRVIEPALLLKSGNYPAVW